MSTRFVRVVETFAEKERYCIGADILYREDVVKLLHREHRAIVRKVMAHRKFVPHDVPRTEQEEAENRAHRRACDHLLAWLMERGT